MNILCNSLNELYKVLKKKQNKSYVTISAIIQSLVQCMYSKKYGVRIRNS